MHAAVKRIGAGFREYETRHANGAVGRDERGKCVCRAMQRRQSHLRIGDGVLRALQPWTAATNRRLRMAHVATIAVKSGPEAGTSFQSAADGIHFLKALQSQLPELLFVWLQSWDGRTSTSRSWTRTGIGLGVAAGNRNKQDSKKTVMCASDQSTASL